MVVLSTSSVIMYLVIMYLVHAHGPVVVSSNPSSADSVLPSLSIVGYLGTDSVLTHTAVPRLAVNYFENDRVRKAILSEIVQQG